MLVAVSKNLMSLLALLPLLFQTSAVHLELANPVLDTPDLTAYDPTRVLCQLGNDASGKPRIQGWCRDWVACIKAGAAPKGDRAAVMTAWKPADCREVCGQWPSMTGPEVSAKNRSALLDRKQNFLAVGSSRDCGTSCQNFQESLSSCVAMILFEPGKVAAMGIPDKNKAPLPAHCEAMNTTCMPDLPIRYQKCMAKSSKPSQECKLLKTDFEECKGCPQVEGKFLSQYHAFVGGCMAQLNAYWQATHPHAGVAAIPGASGCTVH